MDKGEGEAREAAEHFSSDGGDSAGARDNGAALERSGARGELGGSLLGG